MALQLKLDELIAASTASNKLISIENLTDEKLEAIRKFYAGLSEDTKKEKENKIHSLEESNTGVENEIDGNENKFTIYEMGHKNYQVIYTDQR